METKTLIHTACLLLLSCNSFAELTVTVDNDILTGSGNDRDYTGGIRTTVERDPGTTWQGGLLVFTPEDLTRNDIDPNDRPYANLLFIARTREQTNQRSIRRLTVSGGVIGSRLGNFVHRTIHNMTGSEEANAFDTQISDGGEPTFRLGWTRYTPLTNTFAQFGRVSLIAETAASLGYTTDASIGVALRVSKRAQWWGDGRDEFLTHLDEPQRKNHSGVVGGFRIRAVGYNALLQGQFRQSPHTISPGKLKRLVGEAWLGYATNFRGLNFRYAIRAQSKEYHRGRSQFWGSLSIGWTPLSN